jgi:hypothetical protein
MVGTYRVAALHVIAVCIEPRIDLEHEVFQKQWKISHMYQLERNLHDHVANDDDMCLTC